MPWAMPPCCWPCDEQRVDDATAVVDGDVADRRRPRRSPGRPRRPHVGPERERRARLRRSRPRRQQRLAVGRPPRSASAAQDERRRRHAGDADPSVVGDDDVLGRGLEQVAPRASRAWSSTRLGRPVHRRPADLQRPRPTGAPPRGTSAGVGLDEADRSIGMPSWSATIMANDVAWPWPCADVPTMTVAVPSGWTSTSAVLAAAAAGGDLDVACSRRCRAATRSPRSRRAGLLGRRAVVVGDPRGLRRGPPRSRRSRRSRPSSVV